jgi:hypothetical protein
MYLLTNATEQSEMTIQQLKMAENTTEKVDVMITALCDISNMCIGDIAMSYRLDAQDIGELIYKATGMTNPELNSYVKSRIIKK